jgi:hypothetical protein
VKLSWVVRDRASLGEAEIAGMFRVHEGLYSDVSREGFAADLAEKDQVVLVLDDDGVVRGYTTLRIYEDDVGWVLFSGDTGMERAAWGSTALQTGWLAAAMASYAAHGPLDWLLLAGGPRTYRYLPLFFRRFWPSPDDLTPPAVHARMVALADGRYGARHRDGIVHLGLGGLRAEHDHPRPDPAERFFRERNPGFAHGDELVCLTRIAPDNLTPAGRRVLARVEREPYGRSAEQKR